MTPTFSEHHVFTLDEYGLVRQHSNSFFGHNVTIVVDSITDVIVQSISEWCFSDEDGNGQSESEERLPDLPLLSEQLLLDELWDMLGECLKELEESHDQHAVLGKCSSSCIVSSFILYLCLLKEHV